MTTLRKNVLSLPAQQRAPVLTDNGEPGTLPIVAAGMPVMYEDEGQEEMGESTPHTRSTDILFYGLKAHLAAQPRYQVLRNLNLYYHPTKRKAYVSPDVMLATPVDPSLQDLSSYRVGKEGPPPVLVVEVLSERTHQQQDLTKKPIIYAKLGIPEYGLVDVTGTCLPQRLMLKQLRVARTWSDCQDADGGITSRLGFRVVIEDDGQVRVIDAKSGKRYGRPEEAQAAIDQLAAEAGACQRAEERVRALEQELARLRGAAPKEEPREKKGKGKGQRRKP